MADGPAAMAQFYGPAGMALDASGALYVADMYNHRIRKIARVTHGVCGGKQGYTGFCVTTIAGSSSGFQDGPARKGQLSAPIDVAVTQAGTIYVADHWNHAIRKIEQVKNGDCGASKGYTGLCLTTLAGNGHIGLTNGVGTNARFWHPSGLLWDETKQRLYVADRGNHVIRVCDTKGLVSTLAGGGGAGYANGVGTAVLFNHPHDLSFGRGGKILIVELGNHVIRELDAMGKVGLFAGTPRRFGSANGGSLQA
ncbi:MAG: hypothetical protein D6807_07970, partial [Alphaproteobacteria bacterium]